MMMTEFVVGDTVNAVEMLSYLCREVNSSSETSDVCMFVILFLTARCHASAVYDVVVCLSVCHESVFY